MRPSALRPLVLLLAGPLGVAGALLALGGGCDEHPPVTYIQDAGPPIAPLDAALYAPKIPVVEAIPAGPSPPPSFSRDGGGPFEGVIDLAFAMPAMKIAPLKVQLFVKGDQAATVAKGKAGVIREIFRPKEGAAIEVFDANHTFERTPFDALSPDIHVARGTARRTIAGCPCEDWTLRSASGASHACVARGLGTYMFSKAFTVAIPWSAALVPEGYFALTASLDGRDAGPDQQALTVTKITPQPVRDEIFTWPDDYKDARLAHAGAPQPPPGAR